MGEKTAVDAVASVVLQKLGGLLVDESFASNKIIGHRLKRMQEDLKKTRSSLTKAAVKEMDDAKNKELTGEYLGFVYCIEDSIEKFALRFTRRRKRLGFLMNHALFLNKFTALKMLSGKLNSIRTEVKELDRRTSGLDGSKKTVTSPHTQGSENADDDDGKGKIEAADGEQHEVNEGGDDDDGDGVAEKKKQTSVPSTSKANDGGETMKHAQSSPTTPTTPGKPKPVCWTNPLNLLKRSYASIIQERMMHSKSMYSSFSYNEEDLYMVGHQPKVGELLNRLKSTDDWIIPLVGELGLGKTMLARAVYGNKTTTNMFEAVAWANIFKESNVTDILVSLLNQVKKSKIQDVSMDEDPKTKLLKELEGQRYLVVLDGVQTRDQWLRLKSAFPEEQNGSKIIFTTCNEQVAESDDQKYLLEKLDSKESWTLFMRKVGLQEDPQDPHLKNIITEGCQGLPLNIVLLGSLLSMKDDPVNWPETLHTLSSHKKWQASDILKLSYNDLDIHLKLCLIYMTLFPKELDIPVRRLQCLWLAEGFVEQKEGEFQEDVAQKHFEDLVKRSLIMVSKQRSDGSPRKCRLPGALRDLLSAEAQDISLFHVHPGPHCQRAGSFSNRRLIEHACAEPYPLEPSHSQQLRSYISFNSQKKDTPAKYVSSLVSKMVGKGLGLLRVLDLEGVYKPSLPENLGDLFHLRYLGLRWTFLDKLPKSVGELPYLETIDLKHTNIDKIPTSIWKLRNLQHLNLQEVHLDKDTPLHFSRSLPKLLTLWGLSVSHESPIKNGLSKLEHLRELGISFRLIKRSGNAAEGSKSTPPAQSTEALVEWISQLKDLRSLRLRSIDDTGCPAHLSLKPFSELKELSHMKLLGKLQELPPIRHFPPQLKVLTLSLSDLNEDPMPILGKLTSLTVLRLLGSSYLGEKMVCKRGTFENLEVLKLWVLKDLKIWEVEEGAMEKLKEVNIRRCCELENFPSRLLQQKTFKELILNDMPTAFKEKVDKECPFKVSTKDFRTSVSNTSELEAGFEEVAVVEREGKDLELASDLGLASVLE